MNIKYLIGLFVFLSVAVQADTSATVKTEVAAAIHATAERWNSQDFTTVLELWDTDEPTPFYLAEEQDDRFIGWDELRALISTRRDLHRYSMASAKKCTTSKSIRSAPIWPWPPGTCILK